MKTILLMVVLAGALALAQDSGGSGTAPLAVIRPGLSVELRAAFWRALAEFNAVKPRYDAAEAKLSAADAALRAACGAGFDYGKDAAGEPVCIAKPEAKPEAKK